jgi:cysteinyl-tRNA synthetase
MLKIHNSLTGEKEEFKPLRPNEVRMYVCGMTNYDYIHVGHARMLTVFDLIQRYLRSLGYKVTYVRNVTDIDDKIIERAAANGENWADLARRFTIAMHEDCATLGLDAPDLEHRSDHRHDADFDRQGIRVCRRQRRCHVLGAKVRGLRPAFGQEN